MSETAEKFNAMNLGAAGMTTGEGEESLMPDDSDRVLSALTKLPDTSIARVQGLLPPGLDETEAWRRRVALAGSHYLQAVEEDFPLSLVDEVRRELDRRVRELARRLEE